MFACSSVIAYFGKKKRKQSPKLYHILIVYHSSYHIALRYFVSSDFLSYIEGLLGLHDLVWSHFHFPSPPHSAASTAHLCVSAT